jgi:gamma-glutamyltranspeptidase/glutathione hydrolase
MIRFTSAPNPDHSRPSAHYRSDDDRERCTHKFSSPARRAGLALVVAGGLLSACGSDTVDLSEGFFGTVTAEEPRAALLGRDVLVDGGSAADAAVTMFFALSATLPSSVGVTASGSCVVHDPATKTVQRLDFLPHPSSDAANATALPLAPRAMFALHARHGTKPLAELIIQGERIARFGAPVSRAFAQELAKDGTALGGDPVAAELYRPGGKPAAQGAELAQVALAATLARLRSEGVGTLYSGGLARAYIDGAAAAGYAVDPDRLRDALPSWSPVTDIEYDNHFWGVAAPTRADIRLAQAALGMILEDGNWADGDDAARAHLLAEALSQATLLAGTEAPITPQALGQAMARFSTDRRGLAPSLPRLASTLGTNAGSRAGATAFFAVDRSGLAVGCAAGLGAPFGTGRLIPTLGVFVTPAQSEVTSGPGAFSLIVGNVNTGQFHMAASGAGGRRALSAMLETVLEHWVRRIPIQEVPDLPRSHFAGGANTLFVEPATPAPVIDGLRRRGYDVAPAETIATGSAFRCVEGLPRRELRCGIAKDPRSTGLMFFDFGG